MKDKRGISAVVVTIMIILVAIIAVTILWAALKPAIEGSVEEISLQCLEVEVEVSSCSVVSGSEEIVVTLNAGEIDKLKVVFYDTDGDSLGSEDITTDIPGTLETKTVTVSPTTGTTAMNIAGVITTDSGEDVVCRAELATPLDCANS